MASKRDLVIGIWYALAALAMIIALQNFYAARQVVQAIPYSQFQAELKAGDVADVTISDSSLDGTYKKPGPDGQPRHFTTVRVAPDIAKELTDAGVTFHQQPPPGIFEKFIAWMLPLLAVVVFWVFMSRQMVKGGGAGGMMAIG